MISFRFFPSASRLATYCWVAASWRIRVVAIRHSAMVDLAFAAPVETMSRMVCPDDACTGLAPHSAAKDRSDFIREKGVVAGCDQQSGGCSVMAHTCGGHRTDCSGSPGRRDYGSRASSWSISASSVRYRLGQVPLRLLRVSDRGLCLAGTPAGTDSHPGLELEDSELVFDLLRGGNDQRMDLVGGLGACLGS